MCHTLVKVKNGEERWVLRKIILSEIISTAVEVIAHETGVLEKSQGVGSTRGLGDYCKGSENPRETPL